MTSTTLDNIINKYYDKIAGLILLSVFAELISFLVFRFYVNTGFTSSTYSYRSISFVSWLWVIVAILLICYFIIRFRVLLVSTNTESNVMMFIIVMPFICYALTLCQNVLPSSYKNCIYNYYAHEMDVSDGTYIWTVTDKVDLKPSVIDKLESQSYKGYVFWQTAVAYDALSYVRTIDIMDPHKPIGILTLLIITGPIIILECIIRGIVFDLPFILAFALTCSIINKKCRN